MNIYFAPLQGHTTAPYRHYHSTLYTPATEYYTPFIRFDNSEIRKRDQRELQSELNEGVNVVPQIIFKDKNELECLVNIVKDSGYARIDLNIGCPFPLQTGKGRGAAFIQNPDAGEIINSVVNTNPEIDFSVKMRLGLDDSDAWKNVLPYLNNLSLKHIALHPRIAKQQYGGTPDMESFKAFYDECNVPLIYNGDLITPGQFHEMAEKYPRLSGLMAGRGLLARPSMTSEIHSGRECDKTERIEMLLKFHRLMFEYYQNSLCGDSQVLDNIKPFWEYSEEEIGRKAWKNIRKASNMAKYLSAVAMIE